MRTTAHNRNESLSELLRGMAEGSGSAFDRFYEKAMPFMLPIAVQLLGDRMEAEDACHDVLLAVISNPRRYDPSRGSVEAWLAIQTKSRCLDGLRKRKKLVLREAETEERPLAGSLPQPEETVMAKLQGEAVRRALEELPGLQRQTLAAAFYSSRSQRELAEEWRLPLGTIKSRMRYGLNHLKKTLERMGWANGEEAEERG
ncbi:RNA polymerase sigma factor [Cohnella thailandensis]|uniref:Sigma-70 family RNA polymerase sigma factor n=1 Tax=Cohnella thailandensis TaxID=557557 RepID=A0A841T0U7_9BACL|nr:sigma-70 family RNA polymerase sigma factor [Cohnella thailandensis]MBB6635487.1 sigma-70 family RNA polymerase sigma factor [Cohnella thailandensis]MBP1974867.1 RNA polymerase sigma-70 factor (ECF subfamily) [Cohnella thailandensis]